jgi:hypothetical protein
MDNRPERSKSWRDVIKVHPAADLFPMMTADELKALGEDIKKNGLRVPVILWEAGEDTLVLLDGRNRLDAMEAVGLPVLDQDNQLGWNVVGDLGRGDPYELVLSANIHRRHLTAEQKRDLIAKVLKAQPEKSDRQIAEQIKASPSTVGKVRKELEHVGDVSNLDTRTDSKGRKQQAHKPVAKKRRDIDDEPAQAEGGFLIYDSCAGGRVVTERSSIKAKADRAAIKQPKPMPDVRAAADRAERVRGDVAKPDDSDEVTRQGVFRSIFLNHASEALRHARAVASLRREASPQEMTADFIEVALRAAKAWSALGTAARKARDAKRAAHGEVTHPVARNAGSSR